MYIGWCRGNVTHFITAVTLARHLGRVRGLKLKPFTYGCRSLASAVRGRSPCYIVGCFEGGEIDVLLRAGVKATVIAKIYDGVYDRPGRFTVGDIRVYPVPKAHRGGLEYLATLVTYFNVSVESRIFTGLLGWKGRLARVLAVTDAWIEAFNLLTCFEVVEDVDDIPKAISYIEREYSYGERLRELGEKLKSSIVASGRGYAIADVGGVDPGPYLNIVGDVLPGYSTVAVISHTGGEIRVSVVTRERGVKERVGRALGGEVRGGERKFTVRIPPTTPLEKLVEKLAHTLETGGPQ